MLRLFSCLLLVLLPAPLLADPPTDNSISLGLVASLTSFAANYGTAVLEGAQLAVEELKSEGTIVTLHVEDDQSNAKNSVDAYTKLRNINRVSAMIGGTWWANSFVKQAERDHLPLLSCETLFNDDVVLGDSHFIMNGDLRNWIRVYEPLVKAKQWKRGVIVRYVSGFGATLAREFEALFSGDGRTLAGTIEYSDIDLADAASVVLKLRRLNPEVIYIDAQPAGLANLLKRLAESDITSTPLMTHSIADDVQRDRLFDLARFREFFFTRRESFEPLFERKFRQKFKKAPYLNADLGYYAVHLAAQAIGNSDPVAAIKRGLSVHGHPFTFDEHNVYSGVRQEVYQVTADSAVPWQP